MNTLRVVAVLFVTLSAVKVRANSYSAYNDPSSPSCSNCITTEPCCGQLTSSYCGAPCAALPTPPSPCAQAPSTYIQIPYSTISCQDLSSSVPCPSPCPVPCAPPPIPCSVQCSPPQISCPSSLTPQSSCSSSPGTTISFSPSLLNVYKFISPPLTPASPSILCKSAQYPVPKPRKTPKLIPFTWKPYPRNAPNPCAASPQRPCQSKYELNFSPLTNNPSAFSQYNNGPSPTY